MRIIKGICGFILVACLFGIGVTPFMYEAMTLNLEMALLRLAVLTLTAILAFIGGLYAERHERKKLDFMDFIHQEYIKRNADERQLNRR